MPELLKRLGGAVCELRSMNNDLLFLGKVLGHSGETIMIAEFHDGTVPPVIYNTEFKILIRPGGGRAPLALAGTICGSSRKMWKLDRLRLLQAEERRTTFRQRVGCTTMVQELDCGLFLPKRGLVLPGPPRRAPKACRLVDVSLGGLQLQGDERFERSSWVLICGLVLLPRTEPFSLPCQVCWGDCVDGRSFSFGCRYGVIPSREEDRLCRMILELQRQDILAHIREE